MSSSTGTGKRKTIVTQGALAYGMLRRQAAVAGEIGLNIVTLPQLAAELAGGFLHLAPNEMIEPLIKDRLAVGGFENLEEVRNLPGMTRAVAATLRKIWHADLSFRDPEYADKARIRDLATIADHLRRSLPSGALLAPSLRDAALARIEHAPAVFGSIRLEGVHHIDPVWRPLIIALCGVVPVEWYIPCVIEAGWFPGSKIHRREAHLPRERISCADPRHEALEALRWARSLIASGRVSPADIGICAASTDEWDEHILALSREARLPVHFPHGTPCLATRDGQRCAALADALLNGITFARVHRLFSLAAGQGTTIDTLPPDWLAAVRGASLRTVDDWGRALDRAGPVDPDWRTGAIECLALLSEGAGGATASANLFLRGRSRRLWETATRAAPVAALELTLTTVRIEDGHDPAEAIVWCPAWQLAGAPRNHVRLLGLTSRNWPRRRGDDPILPAHIVPSDRFDTDPVALADLRAFDIIAATAAGQVVLSRGRRNASGHRVTTSPLFRSPNHEVILTPTRIPEHALTESDRLFARPAEAATSPEISSAIACWNDWHASEPTSHDGVVASKHPVILRALSRVQSPTSLSRLIRDPLGFLWHYGFGWREFSTSDDSLELSPSEIGRLVHELLRRTVDALEPDPGFTAANADQINIALEAAARHVEESWPLEVAVPPHLLWVHFVRHASAMALAGLSLEPFSGPGTRSWTEVPFGQSEAEGRALPWDPSAAVTIPDTAIAIRGKIDRLDLRSDGAVRVTDYKTGALPDEPEQLWIAGGAELQRVLYALACTQLLDSPPIRTRLIYLKEPPGQILPLPRLDNAIDLVSRFVRAACEAIEAGKTLPGIGAQDEHNSLRLALPASPGYFRRKGSAFRRELRGLAPFWRVR